MNTTPTHFLVYDPAEQKWLQTSLEDLTMRNDPDLYVIAVYETGEQSKQCTWAEYPAQQKKYELQQKEKYEHLQKEEELKKRGSLKEIAIYNQFSGWQRTKISVLKRLQPKTIYLKYENGTVKECAWEE